MFRFFALGSLLMTHLTAQDYQIGGSIFIAAICKDGIIVVSDSRGSVLDKRRGAGAPIAYFDGIQKIFFVGDRAVVNTGQGFIGTMPIRKLWERTFAEFPRISMESFLPRAFEISTSQEASPDALALLKKHRIALAGFRERRPAICYYDGDEEFGCTNDGFVQSSPTTFRNFRDRLPSMTMAEATTLAKQSMVDYITADPKRKLTMGGDFHVAQVTMTGPSWTPPKPTGRRWNNADEFIAALRGGQVPLTLVPPATRMDLEELLSGGMSK